MKSEKKFWVEEYYGTKKKKFNEFMMTIFLTSLIKLENIREFVCAIKSSYLIFISSPQLFLLISLI